LLVTGARLIEAPSDSSLKVNIHLDPSPSADSLTGMVKANWSGGREGPSPAAKCEVTQALVAFPVEGPAHLGPRQSGFPPLLGPSTALPGLRPHVP
jgi:hypothetical protein